MKQPIDIEKLSYTLLKLVFPLKPLPCQTVDAMVFIKPEDIAFITTAPGGIEIVDVDGNKWRRFDSVTGIEKILSPDPMFLKVSRSSIANLRHVKALYTTSTGVHEISFRTLADNVRISISDSAYNEFKKAMGMIIPDTKKKTP